jgi:hypothetical protein
LTELFTDWYLETLLNTQKPGASTTGSGTGAGADAGAAYGEADNGLLGGNGLEGGYDPSFAGHNGNGAGEGY